MTEMQTQKKWYDNKLVVTILCIFFFPVGLYALWKNNSISKGWKIGVSVIIGLMVIASIGGNEDTENSTAESSSSSIEQNADESEPEKDPKVELKEQLERELKSFDGKPFDGSNYRETIQSIQIEVVLFNVWAKTINEARKSDDAEIKKLGQDLEAKVKKVQISEFPKMRKAYKDIVYEKLWLENIETNIKGKGNTILELTGGAFASNKMKQQTQETLSEILNMLRFKRVNYRFTKYDDEYTYYDINSPKDNEIIE